MAEALVNAFKSPVGTKHGVEEIVLIPSGGGRFEVIVDGNLVYSKLATGRHATIEEVLDSIRKLNS